MSTSFDPSGLHTELFIDGTWQKAASGATFPVENPATHEVIAHVADGGPGEARVAIEAYVFAENMDKPLRFSAELEVGMVGLNTGIVSNEVRLPERTR